MHTLSHLLRNLGIAAVVFCARPFPLSAQVGLGLTPMREEFRLAPGDRKAGILTLTNDVAATTRVVTQILDFYLDDTATPQFVRRRAEEAPYSCREWVVANPMDFEVAAKQRAAVRYTLRVPPATPEGSYHCAVGFLSQPPAGQAVGMGLRTAVQIVASIYVVVGRPAVEGTVKGLRLEYVPHPQTPGWRAVVVFSNPSLMHFRPEGSVEVLDESGQVAETVKLAPLPVLPKRDQNFIVPLELKNGPGTYTLRARVDLGMNEIQEATARVVATKPAP